MPRLRKQIVSAGVYYIPDPEKPGQHRVEFVPPERIQHWASEGNRFLQNGNKIPAPWTHLDPKTKLPIVVSPNGVLPSADINGGFWDRLVVENDPEKGPTLIGEVDVDGDENDPKTPAGKVGKTVRETSIFAAPTWKDGKGNDYRDVPLHVAMITNAIEPGQKNFEKLPAGTLALAMSHLAYGLSMAANPPSTTAGSTDPGTGQTNGAQSKPGGMSGQQGSQNGDPTNNATSPDIAAVIQALRQCGLDLPDDTTPENIFERLLIAARQKAVSEGTAGGNDLYQPPGGAETKQPAPVAMSQTPATVDLNAAFANITKEVLMSHPVVKGLVDANNQLLELATNSARATLQTRIKKLIDEGRITQKYADEQLAPLVTGFAMSQAGKSPIEATLMALEQLPTPARAAPNYQNPSLLLGTAMSAIPQMGQAPDNPFVGAVGANGQPLNSDDIVNDFFKTTGGEVFSA